MSQQEFEAECMRGWPKELCALARVSMHDEKRCTSQMASNKWLLDFSEQLSDRMQGASFDLIESDDAIREKATRLADLCIRSGDVDGMRRIAVHHGIEPPDLKKCSRLGQFRRLSSPGWWRRRLRSRFGRVAEDLLRAKGLVRRGLAPYITDFNVRRRRQQLANLRRAIDDAKVVFEFGEEIPLRDVVASSTANKTHRRTELMVRMKGLESIARSKNHSAVFLTLTLPSAFHAQLAKGGPNPLFEGYSINDGMKWLNQHWQQARATFHRRGLLIYGIRVAEPHHDGTPHFHVLLFMAPQDVDAVSEILKRYWLREYKNETGAEAHRVNTKILDLNNGSVVGYIGKYIAKNIDGHSVDGDTEAEIDSLKSAERVDAWASTHAIRQFQQIGGPAITIWRELRRMGEPVANAEIEQARTAANDSDYAGFAEALGGIQVGRRGHLNIWTEVTGELSIYDELKGPVIAGIRSGTCRCRTRNSTCRIVWGTGAATGGTTCAGARADSGIRLGATGVATGACASTGPSTRPGARPGTSTDSGAGPSTRPPAHPTRVPARVPAHSTRVPVRVPAHLTRVPDVSGASLDPWQ